MEEIIRKFVSLNPYLISYINLCFKLNSRQFLEEEKEEIIRKFALIPLSRIYIIYLISYIYKSLFQIRFATIFGKKEEIIRKFVSLNPYLISYINLCFKLNSRQFLEGEKEETRGKFVSLNRSIRSSRFKFIVSFAFFISWQGERGTEEDGAGESTGGVEGEKLRGGGRRGRGGEKMERK